MLAVVLWLILPLALADHGNSTSTSSSSSYPPLPDTSYDPTIVPYQSGQSESYVQAVSGKLTRDGADWTFTTFNNPDIIKAGKFEIDDALSTMVGFGRPVTRVYTLGVTSVNVPDEQAFVTGWSTEANDWEYNEEMFKMLDYVMDSARRWGVKICLPVINQDFGDQSTNYNGNWADLIGFYYGIENYNDTKSIDFWTDEQMIEATKKLYSTVLNRVNSINGVRYGDDNAFWAIETGNELNYNMTEGADKTRPPPGSWTATIAQHIKSLAPNLLVADGSFSRNNFTDQKWAQEALESPHVDLYSSHYYAPGDDPAYEFQAMTADSQYINSYGKTFFIGEHGFYPWSYQWDEFYYQLGQTPGVAGAMAWGMRPHSSLGGFQVHSEGNGIFSYHMPGWSPPADPSFDVNEYYVARKTYQASYGIIGESQPEYYPIPPAPTILSPNSTDNGSSIIAWQGAPWAEHYQVYWATEDAERWTQVANVIRDNVGPGLANYTLPANNGSFVMRGMSVDLQGGPWSNVVTL